MSSKKTSAKAEEIEQVPMDEQMESQYISYAKSVIVQRALPDCRDGLKPVQRRILYSMYVMGVSRTKSYRKSSSIVGECMGDYHPHGDRSIYDALTKMAQEFSTQIPLVDGQGNFGSLDGDPAAAMRYTEARLSQGSEKLLEDIEKDTVRQSSNYDNRLTEPDVLPAQFPNVLVNGASGIAVGMTTSIPPHNIGEVIDATIHRIKNPNCSIESLMQHMPAPDFPTGATIVGTSNIKDAYETGKGKLRVRADYRLDRDNNEIIITEVPYQRKKSDLIEDIADGINKGKIEGATDVRDESDRTGVKIRIEIKSTANIDLVENQLISNALETTVTMNHICLVNDQPKRLSLSEILDEYISHRRNVITRRSEYKLEEKQTELEKVNGRLIAIEDISSVVELVRNSSDRSSAIDALKSDYGLSNTQAENIARMQLSSLTGLEEENLKDKKQTLEQSIAYLQELLDDKDKLDEQVIEELNDTKNKLDHERKTDIKETYDEVEDEDLIPEEDNLLVMTQNNYIKRIPMGEFRVQHRNGKGVLGIRADRDTISDVFTINSHSKLILLSSKGKAYSIKGYEIPSSSRESHGVNIASLIDIDAEEEIESIIEFPEESENKYLAIATQEGKIKKTDLTLFEKIQSNGLIAATLRDNDTIADAIITEGQDNFMIASSDGMVIKFDESQVRPMGRTAAGVNSIKLDDNHEVSSICTVSENTRNILVVTENGKAKRVDTEQYRLQNRGGLGLKTVGEVESTGEITSITPVKSNSTAFISDTNNRVLRTRTDEVSKYGRNANGVNVMDTEKRVVSCCVESISTTE